MCAAPVVAHEQSNGSADPSDHRLHKPGVAGSSPAAATSTVRVQFDEPVEVYHADLDYLGSTLINCLAKSATLFLQRGILGQASESSDALALGKLWHTLRELGADQFYERVVQVPAEFLTPGGALSTKQGAKDFLASLPPTAIPLTPEQAIALGKMVEGFNANPAAVAHEEAIVHREVSIRWASTAGVLVKCRPDAICEGGVLLDWKSTREPYPLRTFHRSVRDYGYGISAALYEQGALMAGLADPPMHYVVSSTTSYETQVITLPSSYMDWARRRLDELLEEVARRRESGDWTPVGYGEVNELVMPGFGDRQVRDYIE